MHVQKKTFTKWMNSFLVKVITGFLIILWHSLMTLSFLSR